MNPEVSRLPNGLTVITDTMAQLESACVGVWVNTGTRNETRPQMGISHMLEHMAFKGTVRRHARQIAEEIEQVGGILNAYTSREQTAFHARVLKADVPVALDILADILIHPTFEPSELERERQVVLQELGQARDTPDDIIFDHLQSTLYQDQPMGWPILGEDETVKAFSRAGLKDHMAAHYRAEAMTLVASGAVSHDAIVDMARTLFADLPEGQGPKALAARYTGGDFRQMQDLEQAHLTYAFPGPASAASDYFIAQAYVMALGGGTSSRLFQEVREKRGLCYSVSAFASSFQDSGFLGIYAGTGAAQAEEISAVIAGEMESIAANLSEVEVERARAQIKVSLLMGLERPSARAEQIAGQLFALGRLQSPAEIVAQLDAIDSAQVRAYAARVMEKAQPSMAAIGPIGRLESHATFCRRFGPGGGLRNAAE